MVQQHQLRPPRAPAPHQHIGGMGVAVHVAVDKDHLRKGLRYHLRHLAELELLGHSAKGSLEGGARDAAQAGEQQQQGGG